MELKFDLANCHWDIWHGSNRTFMELKFVYDMLDDFDTTRVLIVPLWN